MFVGQNSNRVAPSDNGHAITAAMSHGIEKLLGGRKFGSLRKPKLKSSATVSSLRSFRPQPTYDLASTPLIEETGSVADEHSLFPQPSFIRPKNSRMVARDEASPTSKACPLPSSISEPAKGGSRSARSSLGSGHASLSVPRRSSSLTKGRGGPSSLSSLVHYEFTKRENKNAVRSLSSLCSSRRSTSVSPRSPKSMRAELDAAFGRQAAAISAGTDTPPPSDNESRPPSSSNEASRSLSLGQGPSIRSPRQPTPGPSPALIPIPDSPVQTPRSSEDASERRPSLQSLLLPQTPSVETTDFAAVSDPILQEPDLGDFLGLSDDDIAESRPSSPGFPIEAASPAVKGSLAPIHTDDLLVSPRTPSVSCRRDSRDLASPWAKPNANLPPPTPMSVRRISARLSVTANEDRAAAMAAFETARIAARYQFDLVYVINLWPKKKMGNPPRFPFSAEAFSDTMSQASATTKRNSSSSMRSSRPDSSSLRFSDMASPDQSIRLSDDEAPTASTSCGTDDDVGFSYRFLAAYGLHTVKAPLQISYGVHNKILQTEGWIEYRGTEPDDYQRGYARSFYTGYVPWCEDGARRPSTAAHNGDGELSDDHGRSEHNRGIIFAAYRKPQPGAEPAIMTAAERMDMQQDAQGLVDMILDFHMVKRRNEQREKFEMMALKKGGFGDVGSRRLESFSRRSGTATTECGSKTGKFADGARGRASI
ncbi:hypothetical protein RB595_009039 [Gaeumannomyces hyphopodioides]